MRRLLKRALDEEIEILGGKPHPSVKIARGGRGQPLGCSGMAQVLRRERARLGLPEHDQHATRYRRVMERAWAGCSDEEITAYSGHDTKDMVKNYAGIARQRLRAKSAWEKRSRTGRGRTRTPFQLLTGLPTGRSPLDGGGGKH